MPRSARGAQAAGGLTRAAFAPDRSAMTEAARDAQFEQFREQIRAALPELDPVADAAEIDRRARLLQRAQLVRMSAKAHEAKRLKARLRKLEADLESDLTAGDADGGGDGNVAA